MTKRCPYHHEPTAADTRIEYTYQATATERRTMVDYVCLAHYEMHKASLKAASSVTPVSVTRIEF